MKIYFAERVSDGLIHSSQACLNPPIDDNLRSREVAAEIHGGTAKDWVGRMVEVELKPNHRLERIEADGGGGYVAIQTAIPAIEPIGESLEDQVADLKARIEVLEAK